MEKKLNKLSQAFLLVLTTASAAKQSIKYKSALKLLREYAKRNVSAPVMRVPPMTGTNLFDNEDLSNGHLPFILRYGLENLFKYVPDYIVVQYRGETLSFSSTSMTSCSKSEACIKLISGGEYIVVTEDDTTDYDDTDMDMMDSREQMYLYGFAESSEPQSDEADDVLFRLMLRANPDLEELLR